MPKSKKLSLESTLTQLTATLTRLEDEQISLSDSLSAFEDGLKLVREAQAELQAAEQRVAILTEESGALVSQPLQDKDEA
jgi:exodeoxyribonuclease VII small subunit